MRMSYITVPDLSLIRNMSVPKQNKINNFPKYILEGLSFIRQANAETEPGGRGTMTIQMESGSVTEGPTVRLISEKIRWGECTPPQEKRIYYSAWRYKIPKASSFIERSDESSSRVKGRRLNSMA